MGLGGGESPRPNDVGSGRAGPTTRLNVTDAFGRRDESHSWLADTGLADTGLADAGLADNGLADNGLAETGLAETGDLFAA